MMQGRFEQRDSLMTNGRGLTCELWRMKYSHTKTGLTLVVRRGSVYSFHHLPYVYSLCI